MNNLDMELVNEIYKIIKDDLINNYKANTIKQLAKRLKKGPSKIKKSLDYLENKNKIINIMKLNNKGLPKIYIPNEMLNNYNLSNLSPKWIKKYEFLEKKDLLCELERIRDKIKKYDEFESLLYSFGEKLEKAVYNALKFLEFSDLKLGNKDNYDISFVFNNKICILEITGSQKQVKKGKVNQLDGWVKKAIDSGKASNEIEGFLVCNAFIGIDPYKRSSYLTDTAKEYLKYHNFKFLTTKFIFEIIKKVLNNELDKSISRKSIYDGENLS
ncbi:MAG: hypothetical protein ACTSVV_12820 [Promethearchaeota archaeon]